MPSNFELHKNTLTKCKIACIGILEKVDSSMDWNNSQYIQEILTGIKICMQLKGLINLHKDFIKFCEYLGEVIY